MNDAHPLVKLFAPPLRYIIHTAAASMAAAIPPFIYFLSIGRVAKDAGKADIFTMALILTAGCMFIIAPFCFVVAAPVADILNRFWRLSLIRIMVLALLLTVPAILLVDYQMYLSSGDDSGPPAGPYSISRLLQLWNSPGDMMLMVLIPVLSAQLAAIVLWLLRYRSQPK